MSEDFEFEYVDIPKAPGDPAVLSLGTRYMELLDAVALLLPVYTPRCPELREATADLKAVWRLAKGDCETAVAAELAGAHNFTQDEDSKDCALQALIGAIILDLSDWREGCLGARAYRSALAAGWSEADLIIVACKSVELFMLSAVQARQPLLDYYISETLRMASESCFDLD